MKLRKVRVQNFRSIVDSGIVDIEERVTVLVGKNEQGKTTFLRALGSIGPRIAYTPSDLPSHLRQQLEQRKPGDIPIITLWLSPEVEDISALGASIPKLADTEYIKVVKYFDGHRAYFLIRGDSSEQPVDFPAPDISKPVERLRAIAEDLRGKFASHAARVPGFQPALPQANSLIDQFVAANFGQSARVENLFQTFATGLTSLPGQDAAIQQDIEAASKALQETQRDVIAALRKDPRAPLERQIPSFVYHSTLLDKIPNEVAIAEFVASPETVSRGMAHLCAVAGLSMQKIQELANSNETATIEAYEDHYRSQLSGAINEFWTQEQYSVNFRFSSTTMSVSISDETYTRRIPPTERSEGFQWYLSFYATLQNEVATTPSTVFLLDNPGLELHADGQRDIKRFLEDKLNPGAQVIYVTHSPAMIDPFNLEQIRKVELQAGMAGTRVGPLEVKDGGDFDLFEPVRTALGASLATSLVLNDFNILVEGAADKPILEGTLKALHPTWKRQFVINGSISESKDGFLVKFYKRAKQPFIVYVDADSSGREIAQSLVGVVAASQVIDLRSVFDARAGDFEIEDIISAATYHAAVTAEYSTLEGIEAQDAAGKRSKAYERHIRARYGIRFNKRRVAERLKGMILNEQIDDETTQNLKRLTAIMINALEEQVDPEFKKIAIPDAVPPLKAAAGRPAAKELVAPVPAGGAPAEQGVIGDASAARARDREPGTAVKGAGLTPP